MDNTLVVVWFCEKCDMLVDYEQHNCDKKYGYALFVGRGPKDPMACRECKTHWPSDKKRCPGCKIRG